MVQHGQHPADPTGPPDDRPVPAGEPPPGWPEPVFGPAEPAAEVLARFESVTRR